MADAAPPSPPKTAAPFALLDLARRAAQQSDFGAELTLTASRVSADELSAEKRMISPRGNGAASPERPRRRR